MNILARLLIQKEEIEILTSEVKSNDKLGRNTIKITPFLDEITRHKSCKGCPLQPSINVYNAKGEKEHLKGSYRTRKELGIAARNWLKNPKVKVIDESLKKLISFAAKELIKKGISPTPKRIIAYLVEEGKIAAMGCYAWNGQDRKGSQSIEKGAKNYPEKYVGITGLKYRINNRRWSTRIVRIGSIGEFARLPKEHALKVVDTIRKSGLTIIAYTHQWGKNPHLKDSFRASCDNKIALKKAIEKGWKAQFSIHESKITERYMEILPGITGKVCDFYSDTWISGDKSKKNIAVTDCNNCRACKIEGDSPEVIIMPFHR